jgi:hypothetical protein
MITPYKFLSKYIDHHYAFIMLNFDSRDIATSEILGGTSKRYFKTLVPTNTRTK